MLARIFGLSLVYCRTQDETPSRCHGEEMISSSPKVLATGLKKAMIKTYLGLCRWLRKWFSLFRSLLLTYCVAIYKGLMHL